MELTSKTVVAAPAAGGGGGGDDLECSPVVVEGDDQPGKQQQQQQEEAAQTKGPSCVAQLKNSAWYILVALALDVADIVTDAQVTLQLWRLFWAAANNNTGGDDDDSDAMWLGVFFAAGAIAMVLPGYIATLGYLRKYDDSTDDDEGCTMVILSCSALCTLPCFYCASHEDPIRPVRMVASVLCHLVTLPLDLVWTQVFWLLFLVAQQLMALKTALRQGQLLYGSKSVYRGSHNAEVYPAYVRYANCTTTRPAPSPQSILTIHLVGTHTHTHIHSAVFRLVENPLQGGVNIGFMVMFPDEITAVNIISLVLTALMVLYTLLRLPALLKAIETTTHGE